MPDQNVRAQLRSQLVATRAERDSAADELRSAEQDLAELNSEGKHVNPEILAAAVARVGDAQRRVASIDASIAGLQRQFAQAGCLSLAPQRILDIEFRSSGSAPHRAATSALRLPTISAGQRAPIAMDWQRSVSAGILPGG
jgi:septal ring factor EnvC (AmiA/AmiB activator)